MEINLKLTLSILYLLTLWLVFMGMGLLGLRFIWPGIKLLLPISFQTETVDSIANFPPFTWWPNLEDARWFGLNAFGQGLVQALLGLFLFVVGWYVIVFWFTQIPVWRSNWSKRGSIFKF